MSEMVKFKGIVRNATLDELLHRANEVFYRKYSLEYWTGKHMFRAKKKGEKYWEISIILGRKVAAQE